MIPDQFEQMVRNYRLLSQFEPAQLRKLLPLAEEKKFPAGRVIFQEGDQSSYLYLIVAGEVALENGSDAQSLRVQTLHAGEAMGWSAITNDSTTHFQARALTPVETIAFPGSRIRAACDRDPEMGYVLMKRLLDLVTERLDATRLQLVRLAA